MELSSSIVGAYVGWTLLALFPRRVVRPSYRLVQDPVVLTLTCLLLNQVCCDLVASLFLGYLAFLMYNDQPSTRMAVADKAVFITGCDQGLGHALALHLDEQGFTVYAGCLFKGGPGEQKLVKEASDRLMTIQVDVTSKEQVEQAATLVAKDLQGKVLHGVVNNAGILMAANMEVMGESDIRKIMEVNLMGVIQVYRAFMPLLRQPRAERARLVNVASNMGLAPTAQLGAYVASKAAVMILNETWRYELKQLGVDVATIVPSGFKTGILAYNKKAMADKWWVQATEEVRQYFGRVCFEPPHKMKNYESMLASDFRPLTGCIVDALLAHAPKTVYYKGMMARALPFLYTHLPSVLWDQLMPLLGDFLQFPVKALQERQQQQQQRRRDKKDNNNGVVKSGIGLTLSSHGKMFKSQ